MKRSIMKFGVPLAVRGEVEIELVDLRVGLFTDEERQLHGVHAAHPRAVGVMLPVAAADAVQNGH